MFCVHLQGRRIELVYHVFFTEKYGSLRLALDVVNNYEPTDMVLNFGMWVRGERKNTTCGDTMLGLQVKGGKCESLFHPGIVDCSRVHPVLSTSPFLFYSDGARNITEQESGRRFGISMPRVLFPSSLACIEMCHSQQHYAW